MKLRLTLLQDVRTTTSHKVEKKLLGIFHREGLNAQKHDPTMNIWEASCCLGSKS